MITITVTVTVTVMVAGLEVGTTTTMGIVTTTSAAMPTFTAIRSMSTGKATLIPTTPSAGATITTTVLALQVFRFPA